MSDVCVCGCDRILPPDAVSEFFYDPDCQRVWSLAQSDRPEEVIEGSVIRALLVPRGRWTL